MPILGNTNPNVNIGGEGFKRYLVKVFDQSNTAKQKTMGLATPLNTIQAFKYEKFTIFDLMSQSISQILFHHTLAGLQWRENRHYSPKKWHFGPKFKGP